ncbi:putative membrane protein [Chitinophaga dinghuensis]|uniref:Putative membrane protein n=1 Tax=Chitinophaga dinghuensis TaxID=1539050 RepID=A0A327VMS6_9BACT|nr:vitamin K epoxide reductase family protein [Chitinophaga dinghuensis]RAJ76631.1 putative membrane protein [Chitinophaga dinghuensis]
MFWRLSEPRPNGPMAAHLFLELVDVKLSYTTLQQEVEDHPDYPSLLSISDVFSKYKVGNITASFAPGDMAKIPPPFITQVKGKDSEMEYFTVVKTINSEKVSAFDPERKKWREYPFQEFAEQTSGVVLLAEPEDDAGEIDFKDKRREERYHTFSMYALITLLIAIFATVNVQAFLQVGWVALPPIMFSVLSAAGVLTGILLMWYDLDRYNPVIQQLCKGRKHVNCDAILQSNAAHIWGVSWSTIGLSYFSGQLIFMLAQGIVSPEMQSVTGIVSLLALPYVFYSVYFQWRIAKQWCVLCLTIQAILLLQASIVIWKTDMLISNFSVSALLQFTMFGAIAFLAVVRLFPMLKKLKRTKFFKNQLKRLKYNPDVFNAVLSKQKNVHEGAAGLGIILGNPNATNKILKVCNPYCGPCAKAHPPIEDLLERNPDVQVQIIFTATNEDYDERKLPVQHLLAIAADNNEHLIKQALDDWYLAPEKNYAQFAARYPLKNELVQQEGKIKDMRDWCDKAGIAHTPTIYVNNHELPNIYDVHDLKNFLSA